MSETQKDPKFGHFIGPAQCKVKDCQGHKSAANASIHKLHEEFYVGSRSEAIRKLGDSVSTVGLAKARKQAAKELGIRGFNALKASELDEAINLATDIASNVPKNEVVETMYAVKVERLNELQELAKSRVKDKLAKFKNKKRLDKKTTV